MQALIRAGENLQMKIAVAVIATVLQVLTLCNAYAHGDHKPKHGGIMGRGDDGISIELVMEKGTATTSSRRFFPSGKTKHQSR